MAECSTLVSDEVSIAVVSIWLGFDCHVMVKVSKVNVTEEVSMACMAHTD